MKALAQEVVAKFSQRLSPLGLIVRELTGDMQLTRREVDESQLIVTTPEKWDVVTRKAGEGSLPSQVRLVILDEVHLLAEERGAVIEAIVARTMRQVEASQQIVRLVGLSATLPGYQDVASFLRVGRGLFFFGPEHRPTPLKQTFIGVTEVRVVVLSSSSPFAAFRRRASQRPPPRPTASRRRRPWTASATSAFGTACRRGTR